MDGDGLRFLQRSLTLRHLRLLIALNELRQVRRVAEALHVSQPAVSKALAEIEAGIGARLFDRTRKGLVPTAEGACLVRLAETVASEAAKAGEELAGIARGIEQVVSVGVMHGSTSGVLPDAIRSCRERVPGVVVTVVEGPVDRLLQQLRAGRLDIVVAAMAERHVPNGLTFMPLYSEAPVVVCGATHPLVRAARVGWPELMRHAWIMPPRSARVRTVLESAWRRMGAAPPDVAVETVSLDLILELLQRERLLALLPGHTARKLVRAGLVGALNPTPQAVVLPIGALRVVDSEPTTALSAFEACLIEAATRR